MKRRLSVLAIAPYCDGTDVGEAWCAYQWIDNLSYHADVTLLTMERPGRTPLIEQFSRVRVITRQEPHWARFHERLNAMAKLSYPVFYLWARRTIKGLLAQGQRFDIAHQFSPIALRYPSPLTGFDVPYVLGPLGGSLETPNAFRGDSGTDQAFTRLRQVDSWRLAHDPWLKKSYKSASAVLGVAPYVGDALRHAALKHFHVMSELGISRLPSAAPSVVCDPNPIVHILHVGRGVRTKGLRDLVRAIAILPTSLRYHVDVAGKGPEVDYCQQLAHELKVADRFSFHGQIPRVAVDQLYSKADIFCFPSFREPSGSVLFEALSFGLPVIVADRGGPGHVVDPSCGIKLKVRDPQSYARDIADALSMLITDPALRRLFAKGARKKVQEVGLWSGKMARLLTVYHEILTPPLKRKEASCTIPNKTRKSLPLPQAVGTGFKC